MFLITGLGNPGAKYASNRHNIGFMAVDTIHRHYNFSPFKNKFQGLVADGTINSTKVLLLKPSTYMNESGRSVREACQFYKISLDNLIVIYDELDLPPGKVRVKKGGGSGGHNGIKSIDAHLGKEYRRLRLGIGHPGDRNKVSNYVLGDFGKADDDWLTPLLDDLAKASPFLISGQDSSFMNKMTQKIDKNAPRTKPIGIEDSHQQLRQTEKKQPSEGAMADMLKKLLGPKE